MGSSKVALKKLDQMELQLQMEMKRNPEAAIKLNELLSDFGHGTEQRMKIEESKEDDQELLVLYQNVVKYAFNQFKNICIAHRL